MSELSLGCKVLIVQTMQKIPIEQLKVCLLVNISEYQRCAIVQTVLSQMFLNEVDIVLKILRLFSMSDQINLMACNYNGYANIDLQNTFF